MLKQRQSGHTEDLKPRARGRLAPRAVQSAAVLALAAAGAFAAAQTAAIRPAAAPAPGVSPLPASPALIAAPVFPLSAVHAGLEGTAYTVLEGSTPQAIGVHVLGVLRDAIAPGKSMILVRLEGSQIEYTGVAAGMSGSPVYIDGKLLGAIGYRIGQFSKEPIAGVTPISQMVNVINASRQPAPGPLPAQGAVQPADASDAAGLPQPISTPMVFDGFSPRAIRLFQQHLPELPVHEVSSLGSSAGDGRDTAPIVPGSAISALIVSGDFNMAATCTVTYVDPKRLLACGHPITRFGDVAFPMTKARVVTTLASPMSPMKVVNTTEQVGAFTEDRQSGILGVFGQSAAMIPVSLDFAGAGTSRHYSFGVAKHPRLTSAAILATVFQAMQDSNGYDDPATYHLTGHIRMTGFAPVTIDDWIAPAGTQPASLAAALVVAQRFDSLFSNARQRPPIEKVSLHFTALPGNRSAEIVSARVLTPRLQAGSPLTVEAVLHPYRLPARLVRLQVKLPPVLPPGPVRLLVSDGATLDHTLRLIANPGAPPETLAATVQRLNAMHNADRLYVTLLEPVPQATLGPDTLPAIPLSVANVLQPEEDEPNFSLDGETAVPLASQAQGLVLDGSKVVTLDIRP